MFVNVVLSNDSFLTCSLNKSTSTSCLDLFKTRQFCKNSSTQTSTPFQFVTQNKSNSRLIVHAQSIDASHDSESIEYKRLEDINTKEEQINAIKEYEITEHYKKGASWPEFLKACVCERFDSASDAIKRFDQCIQYGLDLPVPRERLALNVLRGGLRNNSNTNYHTVNHVRNKSGLFGYEEANRQFVVANSHRACAVGNQNHILHSFNKELLEFVPVCPAPSVSVLRALTLYALKRYSDVRSVLQVAILSENLNVSNAYDAAFTIAFGYLATEQVSKMNGRIVKQLSYSESIMESAERVIGIQEFVKAVSDKTCAKEWMESKSSGLELFLGVLLGRLHFDGDEWITCAEKLEKYVKEKQIELESDASLNAFGDRILFDIYMEFVSALKEVEE